MSQHTLSALVIDDDADQAKSLAMVLRHYGWESHACVHAKDCLATVETLRPAVILLDLSMPGMTGFDIADEFRHNPDLRPMRLVAITGHAEDALRQRTKTCGFDAHLVKPVDFRELEGVLEQARQMKEMRIPTDEQTRARAYAKWEAAGRPSSEEEGAVFWYEAQRELLEEQLSLRERP